MKLVIGLGNPLSGDDGFGTRVVDRLRHEPPATLDSSCIVDGHTDLLNQFHRFTGVPQVILVDAIFDPERKYGVPGEVVVVEHEALTAMSPASSDVHQVSPLLALQLFLQLHPKSGTRFTIIGLCTDRIAVGSYSRMTESSIEYAASLIRSICET